VWHVQNGEIVGTPAAGQDKPSFLFSQQKFTDFDLKFQATIVDGVGDCGIYFRGQVIESGEQQVVGPLCMIYGKDPPNDRRTGSLVIEPQHKVEKKAPARLVDRFLKPTMNRFHLRCQGKHVLLEVNGIKTVNGEFAELPDEGVIAWKLDGGRRPNKVTIKIVKFTDLTGAPPRGTLESPSLADANLLIAELKYDGNLKKADEALLKAFDVEIVRLQKSGKPDEATLLPFVEHEKEIFKEKGLIPWSRPMRKALAVYAKGLAAAQKSIGNAFDIPMERAEKAHDAKLKEALEAEAGKILAPRPVATWQADEKPSHRFVFFSDSSFVDTEHDDSPGTRFWQTPIEDRVVIEWGDPKEPTSTLVKVFRLTPDGKTLVGQRPNGKEHRMSRVDE
jgi:hypothetical protein